MKRANLLLIGLLFSLWASAQWAVIDHIYSEQHQVSGVCDWCFNHNKSSDDYLVSSHITSVAKNAIAPPVPTQYESYESSLNYTLPAIRAPPLS
ncbi:hypothetical protein [Pleionea litopenaei]|uniref:Uncharacterized protein n=1 Tax=Pleionea litopenaei TaxID=3070815 RepID=A0AA51RR02_9GAMM|nr:hypothetical protein [Pleionea sp. HL-JVS1]WMS85933.1 hypothetical protein Q9312_11960 [Pleionea sp. HL-JVS1]